MSTNRQQWNHTFSLWERHILLNVYSRASLDSDCSNVDTSMFEGIGPDMKCLWKHVNENVRIKTCTPTPSVATTVFMIAMFEPPRPVTPKHPHPLFPWVQSWGRYLSQKWLEHVVWIGEVRLISTWKLFKIATSDLVPSI